MKPEKLTISYKNDNDPKALGDVRDVATSLASIADMLEAAYQEGGFSKTELSATFKEYRRGSDIFDVCFKVGEHVAPLLLPNLPDLPNMLELLGFIKGETPGMMELLTWKKENPDYTEKEDGQGNIVLNAPNAEITINNTVNNFSGSTVILEAAKGVAQPLHNGSTRVVVETEEGLPIPYTQDELSSVEAALKRKKEDFENITEKKIWLIVARPSIVGGERWSFKESSDGREFTAAVKDVRFLERVVRGMPFGNGDMVEVVLQTRQTINSKGNLESKRLVLEVLDIRHPPEQGRLV